MLIGLNEQGERVHIQFAEQNEEYKCPLCHALLIQRRGEKNVHHFAHKPTTQGVRCDEWNYDKSDWHISWQNLFPRECQEVVLEDVNGKRHIADVLINKNVIEFQHSQLSVSEFCERNTFYNNLGYKVFWLFDARDVKLKTVGKDQYTFSREISAINGYDYCEGIDVEIFLEFEGKDIATKEDFTVVINGIKEKQGQRYILDEQIDVEDIVKIFSGGITYDEIIEKRRAEEEKIKNEQRVKAELKVAKTLRKLLGLCPETESYLYARDVLTGVSVKIENTDDMLKQDPITGSIMTSGWSTYTDKIYKIDNQKNRQWVRIK